MNAHYLGEVVAGRLPTITVLVAEADDGSVGGVVGHAIVSTVYEIAELQRIAAASERRRQGIAGQLLAVVRRQAADDSAQRLLLEVREDNAAAIAFYQAAGFAEIDRRRRYYSDGTTAIVFQLTLSDSAEFAEGATS